MSACMMIQNISSLYASRASVKKSVTIAGQQFDHIDNLHHQALITDILLQKLIFFRLVAKYLGLLIWMAMCINLRVLPK